MVTNISVSIEENFFLSTMRENLPPDYKEYKISVEIGSTILSGRSRVLDDDEASIEFPHLTALEAQEKQNAENTRAIGWFTKESVPMTSIDDAVKNAANTIERETSRWDDLSRFSQPVYTVKNIYNSLVKPVKAAKTSPLNKGEYVEHVGIENPEISEINVGDVITITNGWVSLPIIHVHEKDGELGFYTRGMLNGFEHKFQSLETLSETGFSVKSAKQRVIKRNVFDAQERREKELHLFKRKAKPGSFTGLLDARENIKKIYDYWDSRVKAGDPLFDQWMVDSYEASEKALKEIEKTIKILHSNKFPRSTENSDTSTTN